MSTPASTSASTIVAEGTWCTECEFFEVPDFLGTEPNPPVCMACGCPEDVHRDAEVVTT